MNRIKIKDDNGDVASIDLERVANVVYNRKTKETEVDSGDTLLYLTDKSGKLADVLSDALENVKVTHKGLCSHCGAPNQ